MHRLLKCLPVVFSAVVAIAVTNAAKPPAPGWTTPAKVIRVLDGDTIEVEIRRTVKVRLLDCWAPEKRDAGGPASTANLKRLLADPDVTLHVPVTSGRVESVWTFGRVLGHVWSKADADNSVNELQAEQGFATRRKQR